jgi:hypothetical protein
LNAFFGEKKSATPQKQVGQDFRCLPHRTKNVLFLLSCCALELRREMTIDGERLRKKQQR